MARYIIFGAGAVGGLIGARLHLSGHAVQFVARGAHREAMVRDGLDFRTPNSRDILNIPVAERISDIPIGSDDIVINTMKTQDAMLMLPELAAAVHPRTAIVCAQNGLESERAALRLFEHVYAAYVFVFAGQTQPGLVGCYSMPNHGILDIGRYPEGIDDRCAAIVEDLNAAGFSSLARDDIMRWKRGKLIMTSANAVHAACARTNETEDIVAATQAEARRCLDAAGLAFASSAEMIKRASVMTGARIEGEGFPGSSTKQSLMRGNPTTEVDYFNGEIALLGRQRGIATPVNAALQTLLRSLAGGTLRPLSPDELRQHVGLPNSHG